LSYSASVMPTPGGEKLVQAPPKIGDRIRVGINHGGAWRPLFWMRVARDGDIYFGMLVGRPTYYGFQLTQAKGPVVPIKHDETEQLTGDNLPSSSRISFHPDGRINFGHLVGYGPPLENLRDPRQLCLMRFSHPARYNPPPGKASNDYDVAIAGFPVDDSKPMYGALIVEQWFRSGTVPKRKLNSMTAWQRVVFPFAGLKRTPDLALQFVIGHGIEGPWPEHPDVVVRPLNPRPSYQ